MLTYFPSPYPGEWWYSVLCRYHVRSGHSHDQTTIRELFEGKPRAAIGALFPNATIAQVLSQLPSGLLNIREIILQHTLYPYYTRFYALAAKEDMLERLCRGESVTLTHIWRSTKKSDWSLRYCPICLHEDCEQYGEPYWHREHQLPLVAVCLHHRCRLMSLPQEIGNLSEAFLPLSKVSRFSDECSEAEQWEIDLATILTEYLTAPLAAAPMEGYSNLAQTLANQGYGRHIKGGLVSLRADLLYKDLAGKFPDALIEAVFGNKESAHVLNRICSWNLTSPERYALLQCFAGLTTERMFGSDQVADSLSDRLRALASVGGHPSKGSVARQLEITPGHLENLAEKLGIKPFWIQNGKVASGEKSVFIKVYLSREEQSAIRQAARDAGYRYDSHFILSCVRKCIETLK